jgi:glycosyltransferase involved in cell wall biosynthesis
MKVLLAVPFRYDSQIGGPAHTVAAIGRGLNDCGIETTLFSRQQRRHPSPVPAGSMLEIGRVDLVHNFGLWQDMSHAVSLSARLWRTPLVLAPLGMLEPWALAQGATKKRIALRLYQRKDLERAEAVHATATSEIESVRRLGIRTPIALIPHGVDIPDDRDARDKPDNGSEKRVMLFLSRLHPKKGLMELVEAWNALRPVDWRAIVAGPDERGHRAEVEAAVRRYGLESSFEFTGPVSHVEKERLLRFADLFVLPTYSENFGLVVPEALARSTPVLTTRGAPWSELPETQCGWWIDTGTEALTRALESILPMSKGELHAMGRRGRKMIIERYSWNAIIAKHVELYRWLDGSASRPDFVQT